MTGPRTARLLFAVGAGGIGLVFVLAVLRLPGFGQPHHPYGARAVAAAVAQHTANAVGSVTFDQRGFDTMGEEFILFAAALAALLLLRQLRSEEEAAGQRHDYGPEDVFAGVRLMGFVMLPVTLLVGGYVVVHGAISPGGGFQGGVVLATGLHLAYLAGDFRTLERLRPLPVLDVTEAMGAATYTIVGFAALASGAGFLANVLPHGRLTDLMSSGTVPLLNVAVGAEVGSAVVLILAKFLEQALTKDRRAEA